MHQPPTSSLRRRPLSLLQAAPFSTHSAVSRRRLAITASWLLVASAGLTSAASNAAPIRPFDRAAVRALTDETGATVSLHPATGAVRFVAVGESSERSLAPRAKTADLELVARDFLSRHGKAFGLSDPNAELALINRSRDGLGHQRLTFEQRVGAAVVFGGVLRAHFGRDGELLAINGMVLPRLLQQPALAEPPQISAEVAAERARSLVIDGLGRGPAGGRGLVASTKRLVIFRAGLVQGVPGGRDHLAWEVEARNRRGDVREWLYLDARTGKLVDRISGIHEVMTRRVFNGGTNAGQQVWFEGQTLPYNGGPAPEDTTGINEIIEFTADAYELFERVSGGDFLSWDSNSGELRAVWKAPQLECPNASWNGSTTNFCQGITTDDIVGHEWAHAYTQSTHDLIYQWQPGALNESYSDIFGELTDLFNGAGADTPDQGRTPSTCTSRGGGGNDPSVRWLLGERQSGNVIRDMWNPNCEGDPGKVSDRQYVCAPVDNGGVHSNSGIPNHAFALLVDGGTYNGQTVAGIGATRAAAIYWRAMTVYQTPTSDFADHADALVTSCDDLATTGVVLPSLTSLGNSGESINNGHCAQLALALEAVEMRRPASQCNFQPLLDQTPPALCTSGNVTTVIANDFEGGFGNWVLRNQGVTQGDYSPRDFELDSSLPKGRPGTAAFAISSLSLGDCADDDESGTMQLDSPTFTLPSGDTFLAFDHYVATEPDYDGGNVKLSRNGGAFSPVPASAFRYNAYSGILEDASTNTNPLAGQPAWSGTDGGAVEGTWGQSQIDLEALATPGDQLVLRFDFGVDGCNGLDGWYVDDVKAYQCTNGPTPPCVSDDDTLCLLDNRYRLEVNWQNQFDGSSGTGIAIPNSNFTGYFAFSDAANVELIVKLIDFGDVVKVFYGQLTNLMFTMTITDTTTGAVRTYSNSEGNCGAVDDGAFAKTAVLARGKSPVAAGTCLAGGDVLCLLGGRYEVQVDWRSQFDGSSGNGLANPLSDLTGQFAFTDPANVELLTKVLDFGDRILFIYGSLSNLEYTIQVTDTTSGAVSTYFNPAGQFCGAIDEDAF